MLQAVLDILLQGIVQYAYYILLLTAVYLNYGSKDSLLLSLVVGFSALIPMQLVTNYYVWYSVCIGIEVGKMALAYNARTRIKYPVIFLCGLMVMCHVLSYTNTFMTPYRVILPALEHLEILSCIMFSTPILVYIKRKIRCR